MSKYVKMTPKEWLKYAWRIPVLIEKIQNQEAVHLFDGRGFVFKKEENQELVKLLETGDAGLISKAHGITINDEVIKITNIGKDASFGGKGEGAGTAKEDRALQDLNKALEQKKLEITSSVVPVKIGGKIYEVFRAETTPGTPKSDFHFVDVHGNEIVWISHKEGSKAKDFQQWGGLSQTSEPKLATHPETKKFVEDIKKLYPNGLPNRTSVHRPIKDRRLAAMSVYGNQYGGPFGRQNVQIVVQGPVGLRKNGNVFELTANHVHLNGEVMSNGYEPVFSAIYKGDRSDFGVKGTRITVGSKGGRNYNVQI